MLFNELIGQLEFATGNAQRALREANASGTDNPTTRVHELVSFIRGIKIT